MSELKNKTIITVATTGAWPTKANNPNVPMTPEEISEDVYACWKAGAAIAHLHMRDDEGHGTMDKEKFRKIDMDSFGILVSMIMGCVMESIARLRARRIPSWRCCSRRAALSSMRWKRRRCSTKGRRLSATRSAT